MIYDKDIYIYIYREKERRMCTGVSFMTFGGLTHGSQILMRQNPCPNHTHAFTLTQGAATKHGCHMGTHSCGAGDLSAASKYWLARHSHHNHGHNRQ